MSAKQYLKFKEQKGFYNVLNLKGQYLGNIETRRGKWVFYPDCAIDHELWFWPSCLLELAEFMKHLEKPTPKRVRNTPPMGWGEKEA
ncbi:MAG: hypothetical protein PHH26_00340 [Candidatus Thermoplasmatota archaeon]|nr:hypothetical protein [Candidatus Thermoplasmatota archaeon]